MKINTKKSGIALAAASTMLLAACTSDDSMGSKAQADMMGKCHGANACKGSSECATNDHSCAGQNACKGHCFITTTKAKCDAVNGGWNSERN